MNDFTKEDLEVLQLSVNEWMGWPGLKLEPLFIKLQSLIDNYCDHKKFAINKDYIKKCNHCGKVWR